MLWRSSGMRITAAVLALFIAASVVSIGAIYWQTNRILTEREISSLIAEARALSRVAARDGRDALLGALSARAGDPLMIYGLRDAVGRTLWRGRLATWPEALEGDNRTAVFSFMRSAASTAHARFPSEAGSARGGQSGVAQVGELKPGSRKPDSLKSGSLKSGSLKSEPPLPSAGQATEGQQRAVQAAQSHRALAIGATVRLPDGARLLVARDITNHRALADAIRAWFLGGVLMLAILAVLAGWAINRLLVARMGAITETAQGIMAGDLAKRIPVTANGDEFDALAEHLNAMLQRIETLMHGLREVSDNIAHDLKTPLSRLRNRAEEALRSPVGDAACRQGLEATLVEADELIRTFNALLRVARLEAGTLADTTLETFDAAALVEDLAEFYEPVAEEAGARIKVEIGDRLMLRSDRQLISQAMTNLIENALKYGLGDALPEARRTVTVGAAAIDDGAALWVADQGRGIEAADRARVLKRFVRLDRARTQPGTGLGLSLVAAVLHQHGGSVELEDNAPGLKVMLRLPRERIAGNVVT